MLGGNERHGVGADEIRTSISSMGTVSTKVSAARANGIPIAAVSR
jgi:hypothetical protein